MAPHRSGSAIDSKRSKAALLRYSLTAYCNLRVLMVYALVGITQRATEIRSGVLSTEWRSNGQGAILQKLSAEHKEPQGSPSMP